MEGRGGLQAPIEELDTNGAPGPNFLSKTEDKYLVATESSVGHPPDKNISSKKGRLMCIYWKIRKSAVVALNVAMVIQDARHS